VEDEPTDDEEKQEGEDVSYMFNMGKWLTPFKNISHHFRVF
jgi:hypothetical protein